VLGSETGIGLELLQQDNKSKSRYTCQHGQELGLIPRKTLQDTGLTLITSPCAVSEKLQCPVSGSLIGFKQLRASKSKSLCTFEVTLGSS
jgi:hypothetical protein